LASAIIRQNSGGLTLQHTLKYIVNNISILTTYAHGFQILSSAFGTIIKDFIIRLSLPRESDIIIGLELHLYSPETLLLVNKLKNNRNRTESFKNSFDI